MIIIPEIKKIAGCRDKIKRLSDLVSQKIDTDDLYFEFSYLVSGCRERDGHLYQGEAQLDNDGLVDDLYYYDQHTGYLEDDFYGTLYFKTNVPGQFVAVPFGMWGEGR